MPAALNNLFNFSRSLSRSGFAAQKAIIIQEEEELKAQLQVAENKLAQLRDALKSATKQIAESERVTAYQRITELTPELVRELIRQITVKPDGGVVISWNFKDELAEIVEIEQKEYAAE